MTESKILNIILGTKSKVEILRVLINSGKSMSGRGIGNLAKVSPRACQISLKNLVDNNVLVYKRIGRAFVYSLSEDHKFLQETVLPIFKKEKSLRHEAAKIIRKHIKSSKKNIISVFWKLDYDHAGESIKIIFVLTKKSGVSKEQIKEISSELSGKYGFSVKHEINKKNEFRARYLKSENKTNKFGDEYMLLTGISLDKL